MKRKEKAGIIFIGIIGVAFLFSYSIIPFFTRDIYDGSANNLQSAILNVIKPEVVHISTPDEVKGIYMTSCFASSQKLRQTLVDIADKTEINSIVIDVKDFSGGLSFVPEDPELVKYVSSECKVSDMKEFVKYLHERGIYAIGRITVFQDPLFTKIHPEVAVRRSSDGEVWKDKKGISYIDPGSQKAWDHIIAIAKSAYDLGFDEINFDYIRFPSDGNMKDIKFPYSATSSKPVVLESFFSYLHAKMESYGIPTSADLFGMTTTNFDDLGIGQVLERTLPYFDFVDPMVYPSHYPPNFNGWKNPNLYPYDLINFVLESGVERTIADSSQINTLGSERIGTTTPAVFTKKVFDKNKIRPWLQDFDYGGIYNAKEVREQIKATYDVGLNSWLIWDPSNRYSEGAFESSTTTASL